MSFGAPEWFWGFLLVPVLIALFVRAEHRGAERLREFVSAKLLPQLAGTVNRPRRVFRFVLQLLGLGLAIVKHNTELYGGAVLVESELGKGTRFSLQFPAKTVMKLRK